MDVLERLTKIDRSRSGSRERPSGAPTRSPTKPRRSRSLGARPRALGIALALAAAPFALASCSSHDQSGEVRDAGDDAADGGVPPDASDDASPSGAGDLDGGGGATASASARPEPRCPADMVRVARRFCVDRFEGQLVDAATGQRISEFYPPSKKLATMVEITWKTERLNWGDPEDQAVELPLLPGWEKSRDFEPRAVSKAGVLPNGYTTGKLAALACKNAGKRLCTLEEWRTACRGERDLPFPYGDKYEQGKCNIFREGHPAMELHNDASQGHSDPRLNLVKVNGKPLLRRTGETKTCASVWEDDAIYDMVGNLDEWIDDPEGTFVGGFFSRSKKDGCASIITAHPYEYFDYSTGTRCCADMPSP
jgi:hypothetical protein